MNPGLERGLATVVSVALAFLAAWLVQVMFGLAAFWLDQSQGLFAVYFAVWAFLSGYVVPTAFLPAGFALAAKWLTFYATLGAPVDIATDGTAETIGAVLAQQAAWVVVLFGGARWLWGAGIRRYGAVGA